MRDIFKERERIKIEIFILCLLILLYLSRTAIPFFKFPFIPIYICFISYSIITFYGRLIQKFFEFSRTFSLLLILAIILIISFILSDKLYLIIFKDVFNSIILLSFYFLLTLYVSKKDDLDLFIGAFLNLIAFFAVIISLNGIAILLNIFPADNEVTTAMISNVTATEPLSTDNNFSLLIVFFGMISLIYLLLKTSTLLKIFFIDAILILYSVDIFLSGSRRGIITLIIIVELLFLNQFFSLFNKRSIFKRIASATLYYLVFLVLTGVLFWSFVNLTTYTFKNGFLEFAGSRNPDKVRKETTFVFLKYASVFKRNSNFPEIYKKIWTPKLNPYDPDSGWGTRKHKTIYPLTGKNIEIVPEGSKGYLMDKTCNSSSRSGNAYSYSTISNETVTKNKTLDASVFCYVSEDFDGTWALLTCEGATTGKKESEYDLKYKGTWQKLHLKVNCLDGNAPVYIYFSKFNVTDFSSLKGYIIYAFPKVEIAEKSDSLSFLKLRRLGTIDAFKYSSMLPLCLPQNNDADPLRKWLAAKFSEDTTYTHYRSRISIDTISNSFYAARVMRWQFAIQLFKNEFNLKQRLFGGGFNFLNWYGFYFLKDKTLSDYPHNPFLSILLYSGIAGLILYLVLIYNVFRYYIMYRKEYYLFCTFFLITFFFSFFSAGSPFDPPIMGFFILLPFFIHSIHKKIDITVQKANYI
jgi:hypothetical protein